MLFFLAGYRVPGPVNNSHIIIVAFLIFPWRLAFQYGFSEKNKNVSPVVFPFHDTYCKQSLSLCSLAVFSSELHYGKVPHSSFTLPRCEIIFYTEAATFSCASHYNVSLVLPFLLLCKIIFGWGNQLLSTLFLTLSFQAIMPPQSSLLRSFFLDIAIWWMMFGRGYSCRINY